MKNNRLNILIILFGYLCSTAQLQIQNGPALEKVRDNTMGRIIGTDENAIYCYKVSQNGRFNHLIIEKYNKSSLQPEASKNIKINEDFKITIQEIKLVGNEMFIFQSEFDRKKDITLLRYVIVSTKGNMDTVSAVITSVEGKTIDYDIVSSPDKTKFLLKACYKKIKTETYVTDFVLFDAISKKTIWTKTLDSKLRNYKFTGYGLHYEDVTLAGIYLDNETNIFYGELTKVITSSDEQEEKHALKIGIIKSDQTEPRMVEMYFGDDKVIDMFFLKINAGQILVGGYIKGSREKNGERVYKAEIFNYKINISNGNIDSKSSEYFNETLLKDLDCRSEANVNYKYKLDYILKDSNDVYFIGQQYAEKYLGSTVVYGASIDKFQYRYMDIIVAKQGKSEGIEWIRNLPYRNITTPARQEVFNQYFAAKGVENLYVIYDENLGNEELFQKSSYLPEEIKPIGGLRDSRLVCNVISNAGKLLKRPTIMLNDDFFYSPLKAKIGNICPRSDNDKSFVEKNVVYFYSENRKEFRFTTIKLD